MSTSQVRRSISAWRIGQEAIANSLWLRRASKATLPGPLRQRRQATSFMQEEEPAAGQDHPLFGVWKGKVTLLPGYDYTKPAFEPDTAP